MLSNLAVRSHRRRDPVAVAIPSPSRSGRETTAGSRGDGRKSFAAADDDEGPEFARDLAIFHRRSQPRDLSITVFEIATVSRAPNFFRRQV